MAGKRPLGKALRATIVITAIVLVMNLVLDVGPTGFYTTFSALCLLVMADFGGARKERFLAYITCGLAGMVLVAVGAFAALSLPVALAVTLLLVFALAYLVLLRGYVGSAYMALLLTYVVSVTTNQHVDTLPSAMVAYAAGSLIAAISAVVLWPNYQTSDIRKAVGKALGISADLIAHAKPLDPAATEEQTASQMRRLVAATTSISEIHDGKLQRAGSATSQDRGLVQLIDDVTRLRIALRWPSDKTSTATTTDLAMLNEVHDALDACSKAIVGEGPAPKISGLVKAHSQHAQQLPQIAAQKLSAGRLNELKELLNASFYYRITTFLTAMIVRHTRLAIGKKGGIAQSEIAKDPSFEAITLIESVTSPNQMLRSNLTVKSPWFRRAAQSAITVTLAVAVAQVFDLAHGFWIVLGTVAALQLDAQSSRKNALGAALGTIIGFAICVLLLVVVSSNTTVMLILFPIAAFVATWLPAGKYVMIATQAGFTVWFVLLVSLANHGLSLQIDELRVQNIGIGLILSLLVTAIMWPNGVASQVQTVLDSSVGTTANYFAAAYKYITSALQQSDSDAINQAEQAAYKAKIRADDVFDMAITQGGATKVDATAWSSVANSIDHVLVAASMVRTLPQFDLAPIPDPKVALATRTDAVKVAHHYAQTIDADYQAIQNEETKIAKNSAIDPKVLMPQAEVGDDLSELTELIDSTIAGWSGKSGNLTFEVDSQEFSKPYGQSAVAMVWAQDWLTYFHWMAAQTEADATTGLKTIQSQIGTAKSTKSTKSTKEARS